MEAVLNQRITELDDEVNQWKDVAKHMADEFSKFADNYNGITGSATIAVTDEIPIEIWTEALNGNDNLKLKLVKSDA